MRGRRAVPPDRGHAKLTNGLDALADLINEAVAPLVTQPRTVGVPVGWASPAVQPQDITPDPGAQSLPMRAAVESDVKNSQLRGRSSRALAPAQPPRYPAERSAADQGVDDEHVETWRLVRLSQEGDGEAFGLLYDRYVDSVFRFVYYRVNDRALAEDFTSETFVRALRRIGTISYQGRDIGAWFITIARNIVLDHIKSARHRLEVITADTVESKEPEQSTEHAVLETLDGERLMQAVRELGEEQRECVMLRFMQGLSVNETAAIMGKNDGAIKALQHRAVRKLADLIGDDLR